MFKLKRQVSKNQHKPASESAENSINQRHKNQHKSASISIDQRHRKTIISGVIVIVLIGIVGGLSWFHLEYGVLYSKTRRAAVSELFEQAARVCLEKGFPASFPDAEIWAKRALNYNNQNIEAYIILARSLSGQQRLGEAAGIYVRGLKLDPDNFEMNFYLANTYRELGEFDLSDQYYEKTVKLQPDNVVVWANWASGYSYNRNDWVGAANIFERALEFNPDNKKLKQLYEMALQNAAEAEKSN
jgi:tetratricopeptide (TPR) repeat protein